MKVIRRIGSGLAAAALGLGLAVGASSVPAHADTTWGYDSPARSGSTAAPNDATGTSDSTSVPGVPRILFDTTWGYD